MSVCWCSTYEIKSAASFLSPRNSEMGEDKVDLCKGVKCTHLTFFLIRRIRVMAKNACSLRHVRVGAAPAGHISVEFYIGYVYGNVNKILIWLKSAKDFGHFTQSLRYILWLPAT